MPPKAPRPLPKKQPLYKPSFGGNQISFEKYLEKSSSLFLSKALDEKLYAILPDIIDDMIKKILVEFFGDRVHPHLVHNDSYLEPNNVTEVLEKVEKSLSVNPKHQVS